MKESFIIYDYERIKLLYFLSGFIKRDPWDNYFPKAQAMLKKSGSDTSTLRALSDSMYNFYKTYTKSKGRKEALYYSCKWAYESYDFTRTAMRCSEFILKYPKSAEAKEAGMFLQDMHAKFTKEVGDVVEGLIKVYGALGTEIEDALKDIEKLGKEAEDVFKKYKYPLPEEYLIPEKGGKERK